MWERLTYYESSCDCHFAQKLKRFSIYCGDAAFQAAVVNTAYGCTTCLLSQGMNRKLDGNCTRILRAVLNKSWRKHPTKQLLYWYIVLISKRIQTKRGRHAGHSRRVKGELISDILLWTLQSEEQGKLKLIYNSSALIQDLAWRTSRKRWMIGTSGRRGSGKSVPVACDDVYISFIETEKFS